jgi:integrase-like protein
MDAKPRLLETVRARIRAKHYSYRTEHQYVHWITRFVLYHGKRHPEVMGASEVEQFLTHLAVREKGIRIDAESSAVCAAVPLPARPQHRSSLAGQRRPRASAGALPVLLSQQEVRALQLSGEVITCSSRRCSGRFARSTPRWNSQARWTPHVASLFRDAFVGARLRHTHGSGVIGPLRRSDDTDLHARDAKRRERGEEPLD